MTNELEHYGVLGMKWGVRRTPEQLGYKRKERMADYGYVKGQSYAEDITFPKGTVGYRVQARPGLKEGPLYLSYHTSDHLRNIATAVGQPDYGIASDSINRETGEQTLYSVKLEAKEPIKAPSFPHAMDIFVEMVGEVGVKKINPYDEKCRYGKNFIESWKKRKKSDLGANFAYTKFVDTMRRKSRSEFYEDFKKRLLDKGYNALVDPEDRGAIRKDEYGYGEGWEDRLPKAPFIILDPQRTLRIKDQKKLTEQDKNYITRYYDVDYGSLEGTDKNIKNKEWVDKSRDANKRSHKKWKQWLND